MTLKHTDSRGSTRVQTWRSGPDAPGVPAPAEVRELLAEVGNAPDLECTLARVALATDTSQNLSRIHDWLLAEDGVIGTSIETDAGPAPPRTFDVLVRAGYDSTAVGEALAAIDRISGVSTVEVNDVALDTPSPTASPARERQSSEHRPGDWTAETFAELTEQVEKVPYEALVEELDDHSFTNDEDIDIDALVAGDDGTSEFVTPTAESVAAAGPTEPRPSGGDGARTNGGNEDARTNRSRAGFESTGPVTGAELRRHLEALDARIAQLRARVAEEDEAPVDPHEELARLEQRVEHLETAVSTPPELAERVETLEAAVVEIHDRWRRFGCPPTVELP